MEAINKHIETVEKELESQNPTNIQAHLAIIKHIRETINPNFPDNSRFTETVKILQERYYNTSKNYIQLSPDALNLIATYETAESNYTLARLFRDEIFLTLFSKLAKSGVRWLQLADIIVRPMSMIHVTEILKSEKFFLILQRNIRQNDDETAAITPFDFIKLLNSRIGTLTPAGLETFSLNIQKTLTPFINPKFKQRFNEFLQDTQAVKVIEEMSNEQMNILAFIDCVFPPYGDLETTWCIKFDDNAMEISQISNKTIDEIPETPKNSNLDEKKKSLVPCRIINSTGLKQNGNSGPFQPHNSQSQVSTGTNSALNSIPNTIYFTPSNEIISESNEIPASLSTTRYSQPQTRTSHTQSLPQYNPTYCPMSDMSSLYITANNGTHNATLQNNHLPTHTTHTTATYKQPITKHTMQIPTAPAASSTMWTPANITTPKSDLYRSFLPESIYKDYNLLELKPMNLKDALEYVPKWDGNRKELNRFITGCFNAKRVVPPNHESALAQAIQNKLQGGAAIASSNTKFDTIAQVVDFFEARYSNPKDYLGLQGELNNIRQKRGESVIDYSNRVRELSADILRAARRENRISNELLQNLKVDLSKYFRRGLVSDVKVLVPHSGDFEETLTSALEAEKESGIPNDTTFPTTIQDAQVKLINTPVKICQLCGKGNHEAKECWQLKKFAQNNTQNPAQPQNFKMPNNNQPGFQLPPRDPNLFCRYCKKTGHVLDTCMKRQRNNQRNNNRYQNHPNMNQMPAAFYEQDSITHNNHPLNREPAPQQYSVPLIHQAHFDNNRSTTFTRNVNNGFPSQNQGNSSAPMRQEN